MYQSQTIRSQCGGAFPSRWAFGRPRGRQVWRKVGAGSDWVPPSRGRGSRGLRDLAPRMERMADFVDRFENEFFGGMETFFPSVTREGMRVAMDVREEDDKYVITADLPGMTKQDVKIEVTPLPLNFRFHIGMTLTAGQSRSYLDDFWRETVGIQGRERELLSL